MSQPSYAPPGVSTMPGLWIYVTAANNGQVITDAAFNWSYYNDSGFSPGWYYLVCEQNTDFQVIATNYNKGYFNSGSNQTMRISISWAGVWPDTQTY